MAEVDDDLRRALVQRVEVVSVLHVQTPVRELVDAPQAVHQFAEKQLINTLCTFIKILFNLTFSQSDIH